MTRETRIGLLVGLLFIIGFAVVLSQLTNKETPVPVGTGNPVPPAASANAPEAPNTDVRQIAYTPVLESERHATPVVAVESARVDAAAPAAAPEVKTDLVPGAAGNVETTVLRTGEKPAAVAAKAPAPAAAENAATISLDDLASRLGGEAVKEGTPAKTAVAATNNASAAATSVTTYEVKAGDTLYKIAKAVYGNSSKHALILEANKDKISGPSGLKIGQKLVIPALPDSAAPAKADSAHPANASNAKASRGLAASPERDVLPLLTASNNTPTTQPAPASASRRVYVVRSGDSLYKIARTNNTNVDKIMKANNLKNAKALKVGDKLEIPS